MEPLLLDTHTMKAKDAVKAIALLVGTKEDFQAIHDHENKHPKKPRKQVLNALEEIIGQFDVDDPSEGLAREPAEEDVIVADGHGPTFEGGVFTIPDGVVEKDATFYPNLMEAGTGIDIAEEEKAEAAYVDSLELDTEPEPTVEAESVFGPMPKPVEADPVLDAMAYQPPSGLEAEALIGETVLITDANGYTHEAIVFRDVRVDERPFIVQMKDGRDTQVLVILDVTGMTPMSWRLR